MSTYTPAKAPQSKAVVKGPCKRCDGSGMVFGPGDSCKRCPCWIEVQTNQRLGALANIPYPQGPDDAVPLYTLAGADLLITGRWDWAGGQLRRALTCVFLDKLQKQGTDLAFPKFPFAVTSDQKLKEVCFGVDKASHLDLVGNDFDLAIIRIGRLGYEHGHVPGMILGVLNHRADLGKPTWLVSDKRFDDRHHAWSQDLADHIEAKLGIYEP